MRRLLLSLLFISTVGCAIVEPVETGKQIAAAEDKAAVICDRKATLTDGRVHIGMSRGEFARLWERPNRFQIDLSTSPFNITEWWLFNMNCEPCGKYSSVHYAFRFENGILTYWSEN